jgi:hypothetical protein
MQRRTLLVVLAGLAVVVAAVVVVLWPRAVPIKMENYVHIKYGMTLREVEAILDGPPGDYRTKRPLVETEDLDQLFARDRVRSGKVATEFWQCDDAIQAVHFNLYGRADYLRHDLLQQPPGGPLDNLLWRLRRQWHRWFR